MVGRRGTSHGIIALGQHTPSDDVGHGMISSPMGCKCDWTTLGVSCHHSPWKSYTLKPHREWHVIIAILPWYDIITLGQHIQFDNIRHDMSSSPLGSTNDYTTYGMACHHHPWTEHKSDDIVCCMPALTLGSTYDRRLLAWNVVIALGLNIQGRTISNGT